MKSRQHILILLVLLCSFLSLFIFDELRNIIFKNTQIDTIGHAIGFFCLIWFLHSFIKLPLINITLCLFIYAALTELGQYYLGFRNGEFRDFIADVIGISFFVLLKWLNIVYGGKLPGRKGLMKINRL